ncbi:hypothetical protein CDAR_487861 [Caerostris darwini]|uniref:Uncharacterized protein n=1 Tax=Caerostris darwini TaxID=1538125 RepID=A0AAV4TZ94_9ARAC|nr:hypothetical protein CDAR_487861 [Caerostris darwini]
MDEGGEQHQKQGLQGFNSSPHPGAFCSNPQNVSIIFIHKYPPPVLRKEIGRDRRKMDGEERNVALIFVCCLKGGLPRFVFLTHFQFNK